MQTITLRKTMLDREYNNIANASKIVFARNPQTNRISAFIDSYDPKKACGAVVAYTKDGNVAPMAELEQIIDKGLPYVCTPAGMTTDPATGQVTLQFTPKQIVKTTETEFDVEGAMQRTIDEGIYTKEEAQKRLDLMRQNFINDAVICRVFDWAAKYDKPIREPKAFYQEENKDTRILSRALMYALQKRPVIYSGSKSVGKNVCAETVAWLLGMPYYSVTFSKKTNVSDIAGDKTTKQSELSEMTSGELKDLMSKDVDMARAIVAKGHSVELVNVEGPLIECARVGGFLQVNEDNLLDANTKAAVINPLIDGSAYIEIPGIDRVYIHPRFIYSASRNPGYEGTCQDNKATMSRCGVIRFPYPKDITKMLKTGLEKWQIDDSVFAKVNSFYQAIYRSAEKDGGISDDVLNIRGLKNALEVWAAFPESTSLADVISDFVGGWLDEEDAEVLHTILYETLGQKKQRSTGQEQR